MQMYRPKPHERPDQPPPGMIAANLAMMQVDVRFPFPPCISYYFNAWEVALIQLHPNGWRRLMTLLVLFGEHRLYRMPSASEINFLYSLADGKDVLYLKPKQRALIAGIPNKVYDWQHWWFWVSGAWATPGHARDTTLAIPTAFNHKKKSKEFLFSSFEDY